MFKRIGDLSGGERAKLEFLTISVKKPNTMILDEPTNHLDLPAKEALETAMADYEGTVFFVSHDRYFLNKMADKIIELTQQGVKVYNGNYDDYIAKKIELTASPAQTEKKINTYEEEKRIQAHKKSITKKLAKAEEDIAAAEQRAEELSKMLEQAGADFEKAAEIYKSTEENEKHLESLYELWGNLSEELSNL